MWLRCVKKYRFSFFFFSFFPFARSRPLNVDEKETVKGVENTFCTRNACIIFLSNCTDTLKETTMQTNKMIVENSEKRVSQTSSTKPPHSPKQIELTLTQ